MKIISLRQMGQTLAAKGAIMTRRQLFDAQTDKNHAHGWATLILAFDHIDAVVSEAELYDSPTSMRLHNDYIEQVVAWALKEGLLEPVVGRRRFRLTAKGKDAWLRSAAPDAAPAMTP